MKGKRFLIFLLRVNLTIFVIPVSPALYFNQRLLKFNQYFASDADYIFFAWSAYEQHYLRSLISFVMYKIKPATLTAGTVKSNFKSGIEKLLQGQCIFIYEFI